MSSWLVAPPPDEIDAGPVRLRRWRPRDAETMARLVGANVEHLKSRMAWAQEPPTVEEEREVLARMHRGWEARTDFGYAVILPDGEPIGGMGLHSRQCAGTLEIGYWIAAAHTGRGRVTAAARALAAIALALPGVECVEIRCDESNHASAAVPRRLGFRLVDIIDRPAAAPADTGRGMIWVAHRGEWQGGSSGRPGTP